MKIFTLLIGMLVASSLSYADDSYYLEVCREDGIASGFEGAELASFVEMCVDSYNDSQAADSDDGAQDEGYEADEDMSDSESAD